METNVEPKKAKAMDISNNKTLTIGFFFNINGTHQVRDGQFLKKPALVNIFIIRLVQAVFSYRRDGLRVFFESIYPFTLTLK